MEILTSGDVAELLRISERTVHRMVKAGLPCFKIGRAVRFRKDRIQAYIERLSNERLPLVRRRGKP